MQNSKLKMSRTYPEQSEVKVRDPVLSANEAPVIPRAHSGYNGIRATVSAHSSRTVAGQNDSPKSKIPAVGGFRNSAFFIFHFAFERKREAFTLLEMIIAIGIFTTILLVAVGAEIAISNAEVRSRNVQTIEDNLRFALESMSRELRTGVGYSPSGGTAPAYTQINFTRQDGASIGYCLLNGALFKLVNTTNCSDGSAVTSNDIVVDRLIFYVIGQAAGPADGQPRVTVALQAHSTNPSFQTTMNLQTTVTQRFRDSQ